MLIPSLLLPLLFGIACFGNDFDLSRPSQGAEMRLRISKDDVVVLRPKPGSDPLVVVRFIELNRTNIGFNYAYSSGTNRIASGSTHVNLGPPVTKTHPNARKVIVLLGPKTIGEAELKIRDVRITGGTSEDGTFWLRYSTANGEIELLPKQLY